MTNVFTWQLLSAGSGDRGRKWECGSSETLVMHQDNVHSSNLFSATAPVISSLNPLCVWLQKIRIGLMERTLYFSDGADLHKRKILTINIVMVN